MKKFTWDDFAKKAREKHGNKYEYSKVNYVNTYTKVKIYCNKCKKYFEQAPYKHLMGKGCSKCKGTQKLTLKEFVKRAKKKHENKYGYNESVYEGIFKPIKIYCKKCNKYFLQRANDHLQGCGCPKCKGKSRSESRTFTTAYFIKLAQEKHNDKYRYNKVYYKNAYTKIEIYCNKCKKYFWQMPYSHLQGCGCPKCKLSKGEIDTKLCLEKRIGIKNIEIQKRYNDCRHKLPLPFDLYLSDYNILIEYHGKQHYVAINYFGGKKAFKDRQKKDRIKADYAKKNNIKFIVIPYTIKGQRDIETFLREQLKGII
jgi:Zn finger protein HypA/HybF involved in hydrogenase expression